MGIEMNLKKAVPFFAVSDMESSLRFYRDGLGFEMQDHWLDGGTVRWCLLKRGSAGLMLQDFRRDHGAVWMPEGPLGLGVSIVFFCEDATEFYREISARGITASTPVVGNGLWVTSVLDPDGYRLEFESPTDVREETVYDEKSE